MFKVLFPGGSSLGVGFRNKTPTINAARARNVLIPKITVMVALFLAISMDRQELAF